MFTHKSNNINNRVFTAIVNDFRFIWRVNALFSLEFDNHNNNRTRTTDSKNERNWSCPFGRQGNFRWGRIVSTVRRFPRLPRNTCNNKSGGGRRHVPPVIPQRSLRFVIRTSSSNIRLTANNPQGVFQNASRFIFARNT